MLNSIDTALQNGCPTVMVPCYQPLEAISEPGHRILATGDGLWVDIYRPWLHATWPITSNAIQVALPYGMVTRKVELLCGPIPTDLVARFAQAARKVSPVEHAAWITWDCDTREFRYRDLWINHSSENGITFDRPALDEGESVVVDLHSHGADDAYFSPTDDKDDRGEVKVSICIGNCDREVVSLCSRLCLLGINISCHGLIDFR